MQADYEIIKGKFSLKPFYDIIYKVAEKIMAFEYVISGQTSDLESLDPVSNQITSQV